MPDCCEALLSATLAGLSMKQAGFRIVEQSVKLVRQQVMGERVTMGICGRDREFLPVSNFVETCRKVEHREMRFRGKSHQLLLPLRVPRRIDYLGPIDDERFDIPLTTYPR